MAAAVERPRIISKNTDAAYLEDPLYDALRVELQGRGFGATSVWSTATLGYVEAAERQAGAAAGRSCTCAVADTSRMPTANASAAPPPEP